MSAQQSAPSCSPPPAIATACARRSKTARMRSTSASIRASTPARGPRISIADELPRGHGRAAPPRRRRATSRSTRSSSPASWPTVEQLVRADRRGRRRCGARAGPGPRAADPRDLPRPADPRLHADDAHQRREHRGCRRSWASSASCWPANARSTRSAGSAARRRCRWRCSSTARCASPIPASA